MRFGGVFQFKEYQDIALFVLSYLESVDFVVSLLVFPVVVVEVGVEHHGEDGGRDGNPLFIVHEFASAAHHFANKT